MFSRRLFVLIASVILVLGLQACKEGTLEPDLAGNIEGRVIHSVTNQPVANVGITTSPPSSALITGADGRFQLPGMQEGNYTITASKNGFRSGTVTVSVQENRTAEAVIFLREDLPDTTTVGSRISVQVLNWTAQVLDRDATIDSARVNVEYRIRNTGDEDIPAYEVYFRLRGADGKELFHEERGTNLGVGQADIRSYERQTQTTRVQEVTIYDYWYTGMEE